MCIRDRSKGTYAVFRDFEVHTRFGTYAVWEGYIRDNMEVHTRYGKVHTRYGGITLFQQVETGNKND